MKFRFFIKKCPDAQDFSSIWKSYNAAQIYNVDESGSQKEVRWKLERIKYKSFIKKRIGPDYLQFLILEIHEGAGFCDSQVKTGGCRETL